MWQVYIMKMLDHPNIVNLIEVIDDPKIDNFYMGILYFLYYFIWSVYNMQVQLWYIKFVFFEAWFC